MLLYDGFSSAGDGHILDGVAPCLESSGFAFEGRASGTEREVGRMAGLHFGMQDLQNGLSGLVRFLSKPD